MDGTCENDHSCGCHSSLSTPSIHQTLDELDFTRGIWTAAVDGCVEDINECLLKKNIHPDQVDSSGYTALHYACRNGHKDIVQILLNHNASPNIQTRSGKVTPLHRAAYCGHVDIVRLLLQHKADPMIPDSDGKLPLHKAAENSHIGVAEILVSVSPAGREIRDKRNQIPIDRVPAPNTALRTLLQVDATKMN